jgi:hypothetical protein
LNLNGKGKLISKVLKYILNWLKEQKIVATNPDIEDVRHSRYLKSFYSEYDKNQARFRKSKGEFTSFI